METLQLNTSNLGNFKIVTALDSKDIADLFNLVPAFKEIVDVNNGKITQTRILEIVKKNPFLTITKTLHHELICNEEISIKNLINLGSNTIKSIIDSKLSNKETPPLFIDLVKEVFLPLSTKDKKNWITFYEIAAQKTSYRYNILAIFKYNGFLTIIPIFMDVAVNRSKQEIHQFKELDIATFYVEISSTKIISIQT